MNILEFLHKKIVEVTIDQNKIAFLGSDELNVLKINFGKGDIAEVLLGSSIIELKRIKSEANLWVALAMKKSNDEYSLNNLQSINYEDKSITLSGKQFFIIPVLLDETNITAEDVNNNPDLNQTQYYSDDYASTGIKLKELFQSKTISYTKQKNQELSAKPGLYDHFINFNENVKKTLLEEKINPEELETQKFFIKDSSDSLSITDHGFALDPNFSFNPEIDFERIIKPRDTSAFWFQVDPSFKTIDDFWYKLKTNYYTNAKDIEYKLKQIAVDKKLPVYSNFLSSLKPIKCFFVKKLEDKVSTLEDQNKYLINNVKELEKSIIEKGENPSTNNEYLEKVQQKSELLKAIKFAKYNLENFRKKIKLFNSTDFDFQINFYVHVFGRQSLISKYDDLIGHKLLFLNAQINDLFQAQKQLEEVLIEKIQLSHEAKKAKAKLDFLEDSEAVSDHIAKHQKAQYIVEKEQKQKVLSEVGQLHESGDLTQELIDTEYQKINYFLNNLKAIENIENFEEKLFKLKSKKQSFYLKKVEYQEYLHKLRLRVNTVEESVVAFIKNITTLISEFQTEITNIYSKNKSLLSFSTNKLWDDWKNNGINLIKKIFEKKTNIIKDFSNIMVYQIQKMHENQKHSLLLANERQQEWNNIYNEIKNEFHELGYDLNPNPVVVDFNYIKEIKTKDLQLSNDTKKALYYQPNFQPSSKGIKILGLEPKLIDDKHFLVIDQVWNKLTPEQEKKLKEKIVMENEIQDQKDLQKKIKHTKSKIFEELKNQSYKFQKLNILDFLSQKEKNLNIREKASLFERYLLHSWKEKRFTDSYVKGESKETLFNLSKSLFSLKSVKIINSTIHTTDTGYIKKDPNIEIYNNKDYFIKAKSLRDFSDSVSTPESMLDEIDDFDTNNTNYLELIDSLDDLSDNELYENDHPPKPPTLEEWAQISIKKFREKKRVVLTADIQNKILLLEDEINKINALQSENSSIFNTELAKRDYLYNEIQSDIAKMQKFLLRQSKELQLLFSVSTKELKEMIDNESINNNNNTVSV